MEGEHRQRQQAGKQRGLWAAARQHIKRAGCPGMRPHSAEALVHPPTRTCSAMSQRPPRSAAEKRDPYVMTLRSQPRADMSCGTRTGAAEGERGRRRRLFRSVLRYQHAACTAQDLP